jgi:hypothetical protein
MEEFPRYTYQEEKIFIGAYGNILDIESENIEDEETF